MREEGWQRGKRDEGEWTDPQNPGKIVYASSLAEMEEVARRPAAKQAYAKGILWDRGAHRLEREMERWVSGQEETRESLAYEQLLVVDAADPRDLDGGGCNDPAHPCKKAKRVPTVAGPGDIAAACDRIVADLPASLRGAVRADAEELTAMLLRLCPGSPWLTLQVEIIGKYACTRWHQDRYVGRATVTYAGPGTWMADDESVRFDQFRKTLQAPMEVSDPRIVPRYESIHRAPPNAVVLIKGNLWPGIPGVGLTHKAPNLRTDRRGNPMLKRLMLKVDLSEKRPGQ